MLIKIALTPIFGEIVYPIPHVKIMSLHYIMQTMITSTFRHFILSVLLSRNIVTSCRCSLKVDW